MTDKQQAAESNPESQSNEVEPLRSVHTDTFPKLLEQLASSILVTTYQAGKLVMLRADGGVLNTHFRGFPKPMGLAVNGGRLAIGTASEIVEYHNVPSMCRRLETDAEPKQPPKHDACFMPRRANSTGDVQIHEMAWVGEELWFINTVFSCLCVRSDDYSFTPKWRPKFISALAPEDRCHMNGLASVDGKVRYVSALGETDTAGGWRENKRDGGILIDIESDEIITRKLSMPHSPRWYNGKLYVLESGKGGIGTIDLQTGNYQEIAQLPGFTRGLSFAGPFALIGLSQVRETAVFSDFPLLERLSERSCGVWVVNIETGETVGFVKFEDALQEIFVVEILPNVRYPDLLNDNYDLISSCFVLPDEALRDVPADRRNG